jgi:hypothetical protein
VSEKQASRPITGDYYRHNNTGRIYCVLHIAKLEATGEEVVVYRKEWEDPWVRPVSEWHEIVDMDNGERRERFSHHRTGMGNR